jgi:hypothetical protein
MNINADIAKVPDEALRLLKVLAEPGGFARSSATQDRMLALFRVKQGLTLGAGQASEAIAAPLLRDGLAAWTLVGRHRHLVVSAAGIARLHHVTDRRPEPEAGRSSRAGVMPAGRESEKAGRAVLVNTRESPLAWLHRRRNKSGQPQINALQFAAGERLRADLERAHMLPRVTANWSAPVSGTAPGGVATPTDTAIAARERVDKACRTVGPEFSGLLIDVCGFLKGLEQVEAERGWPSRSAKLLLAMALDRLAAHYGLNVDGRSGSARNPSRPRSWRASGARPTLMPEPTRVDDSLSGSGSGGENRLGIGPDTLDH